MPVDRNALQTTLDNATRALLDARGPHGHWEGELSSSALSTATAVFALSQVLEAQAEKADPVFAAQAGKLIRQGLGWLALNQNADGGWGDTTLSFSNISTTCLCWAAFVADENWAAGAYDHTLRSVEKWLIKTVGTLAPDAIAKAIVARYGEDHTFSVPILTMCAMAGRLGLGPAAWDLVPPLPFELAAFPQRLFKWLKLPVVSYALPALIAIGQVRHARRPSSHTIVRTVRNLTRERTLKLLTRIQPTTGGFLEATPLTSFVVMSLAAAGNADHAVVKRGIEFLARSVRDDGSWPIDTNLATWVTTLAVNALANHPEFDAVFPESERKPVRDWLLGQQYRKEHPYTLANPGGWAWTDLPGGVPDADDTPGALLALKNLGNIDDRVRDAAAAGVRWLLSLQNRDGGMPTFCKGWGKLPFDKSSADLSSHAVRGLHAWIDQLNSSWSKQVDSCLLGMIRFLESAQRDDGSWMPLWFGNQHIRSETNSVYGTSRVLLSANAILTRFRPGPHDLGKHPAKRAAVSDNKIALSWMLSNGARWLLSAQNADGGWGSGDGSPSSIEETALALEALAPLVTERGLLAHGLETRDTPPSASDVTRVSNPCLLNREELARSIDRGIAWLNESTCEGADFSPTPIGFYFAKLWYWEKLYPLVWAVSALGLATQRAETDAGDSRNQRLARLESNMDESNYTIPAAHLAMIRRRVADAAAWCAQRLDIAAPGVSLRSPALRPPVSLIVETKDENGNPAYTFPSTDERYASVRHVAEMRSQQLQGIPVPDLPEDRSMGRLLVVDIDLSVWDGFSAGECDGFVDDFDIPAWDTWVDLQRGGSVDLLLCWVPMQLVRVVTSAIEVNCTSCLRWADEMLPLCR